MDTSQPESVMSNHTQQGSGRRQSVVDSRDLLRGKQELQISHEGEVYRLRITRNGRLILNK